jgi:hypothetical protein
MPRQRPAAVLVIAIFHFIFAACGGIGSAVTLAGAGGGLGKLSAGGDPKQAKMQEDIERSVEANFPAYKAYQAAEGGLGLLLALVLLAAGIGLLTMQPWARLLSLVYAVVAILNQVVGMVVLVVYVLPAMRTAMRGMPGVAPDAAGAAEAVASGLVIGGGCLGFIYPVAVLIVMLLPHVGRAFRGPGIEEPRPERDDWDEDQYERRERWGE